jgi:2',3'-cyclic-nucleotide 2'-phosphodiesterase (5'-nucleotidase family)
MKVFYSSLAVLLLFVVSCKSVSYHYTERTPSLTRINQDSLQLYDTAVHNMIAPYKLKLDSQMNVVIGTTIYKLTKDKPEGSLGNLLCDAAVWYAAAHYDKPIDICVMNAGGIRLPNIEAGNITVGKMYELMPFDNMVDVLEIKGEIVDQFLQLVAAADGWPVAGLTMQIENGKAVNILIGGKPLVLDQTYTLVTSDYVANGGDKAEMLKLYEKRTGLNYLLRDALIEYVKSTKTLNQTIDGRITRKP